MRKSSTISPKVGKGAETRREIIRQAAPIFNRQGYAGAAMSDLMRATGLEKGGIYRHFKSKQQLAAEAFDYAWDIATKLRLEDTEHLANSVDRLLQLVRNFRDRREGLVPGGCPLLNTAIDADNGNFLLRRKAKRALDGWLARVRNTVQQGQQSGEIRADVDPVAVAATARAVAWPASRHVQKTVRLTGIDHPAANTLRLEKLGQVALEGPVSRTVF